MPVNTIGGESQHLTSGRRLDTLPVTPKLTAGTVVRFFTIAHDARGRTLTIPVTATLPDDYAVGVSASQAVRVSVTDKTRDGVTIVLSCTEGQPGLDAGTIDVTIISGK